MTQIHYKIHFSRLRQCRRQTRDMEESELRTVLQSVLIRGNMAFFFFWNIPMSLWNGVCPNSVLSQPCDGKAAIWLGHLQSKSSICGVPVVDPSFAHALQQTACDTRLMSFQLCFHIKSQLCNAEPATYNPWETAAILTGWVLKT